jgi:hypothetical protein
MKFENIFSSGADKQNDKSVTETEKMTNERWKTKDLLYLMKKIPHKAEAALAIASLSLITFIAGHKFDGSDKDQITQNQVKDYFEKNAGAERIDLQKIESAKLIFEKFKNSVKDKKIKEIDMRDSALIKRYENDPSFKNHYNSPLTGEAKYEYKAWELNDSTIMISDIRPQTEQAREDVNNAANIPLCTTKYIFPKNGDVEIEIGNAVQGSEDKGYMSIDLAVDGKTGGIYRFGEEGWHGQSIVLEKWSDKLEMITHSQYKEGHATAIFNTAFDDLQNLQEQLDQAK